MATFAITDDTFEDVIATSDKPVLVDFWADWCGPCKMIAPVLEQVSEQHADKLSIAKIDVVDNPQAPERYQVLKMPTLLLFNEGKLVKRLSGAMSKQRLLKELSPVVGPL